jgi:hypothetical protein
MEAGMQSPFQAGGTPDDPTLMDPAAQIGGLLRLTQQATDLVLQAAEQMPNAPLVASQASEVVMAIRKMNAAMQQSAQLGNTEETVPVP